MNYKIVHNEQALKNFIDWLPELKTNERFFWCLFARKKYSPGLIKSNDRTQLKRGLATKENLLNKLYQLELPLNRWVLKDIPAPQESLVVYINPNPRDMIKGAWKTVNKLCKILENHSNGHNPIAETTSAIQQSKSRNWVVDFDIDADKLTKQELMQAIKSKMPHILPSSCYDVLETRGGYHILVYPSKFALGVSNSKTTVLFKDHTGAYNQEYHKNWYKAIQNAFGSSLDQAGDQLIPIPGCVQGGFIPKFI